MHEPGSHAPVIGGQIAQEDIGLTTAHGVEVQVFKGERYDMRHDIQRFVTSIPVYPSVITS